MLSFACISGNDKITSEISNFLYSKNMDCHVFNIDITIENPEPIWNDGFIMQLKIEKLRKIVNLIQYDIICIFIKNKAYWYLSKKNILYLTEFNENQSTTYREFIKNSLTMLFNKYNKEILALYKINIRYPHIN